MCNPTTAHLKKRGGPLKIAAACAASCANLPAHSTPHRSPHPACLPDSPPPHNVNQPACTRPATASTACLNQTNGGMHRQRGHCTRCPGCKQQHKSRAPQHHKPRLSNYGPQNPMQPPHLPSAIYSYILGAGHKHTHRLLPPQPTPHQRVAGCCCSWAQPCCTTNKQTASQTAPGTDHPCMHAHTRAHVACNLCNQCVQHTHTDTRTPHRTGLWPMPLPGWWW